MLSKNMRFAITRKAFEKNYVENCKNLSELAILIELSKVFVSDEGNLIIFIPKNLSYILLK